MQKSRISDGRFIRISFPCQEQFPTVPSPPISGEKVADRPDEGAVKDGRVRENPPHPLPQIVCVNAVPFCSVQPRKRFEGEGTRSGRPARTDSGQTGTREIQHFCAAQGWTSERPERRPTVCALRLRGANPRAQVMPVGIPGSVSSQQSLTINPQVRITLHRMNRHIRRQ